MTFERAQIYDARELEEEARRSTNVIMEEDTCSLSRAFDEFFMCYSFGSQAVNYYRYGTYKDCGKKFDDFKFCLSVKSKPADVQARMMQMRSVQKEQEKLSRRNSEDVWEART